MIRWTESSSGIDLLPAEHRDTTYPGGVFGNKKQSDESDVLTADDAPIVDNSKGRPTPKRKDAEAARKQSLKSGVSVKPGSSKREQRNAARESQRQQRAVAMEGMRRGDERYLPARDQGPVRKFVRDYVDSRRTISEFFVIIALVILVVGVVGQNLTARTIVTMLWMLVLIIVITETALMLFRLNSQLKRRWPDKADRKGTNFYAVMRMLQIRRLRLPPPSFKANGQPVTPKK